MDKPREEAPDGLQQLRTMIAGGLQPPIGEKLAFDLVEVERGDAEVILFGLCGHGNFDLAAYDAYLSGSLEDPEFSEADMDAALARLPEAPAIA